MKNEKTENLIADMDFIIKMMKSENTPMKNTLRSHWGTERNLKNIKDKDFAKSMRSR